MPFGRGWIVVAFVAVLGSTGCGPGSPGSDGGRDVPTPDGWTGTTPLFGRCGADQECAFAAGVQCLTTFPGGLCVRRCDNDVDCGIEGVCAFNVCLPRCILASGSCIAIGGACSSLDSNRGFCTPSCFPADVLPPGERSCINGTTCDPYANSCTTMPTTTGADDGAPCRDDSDCRGFCIAESVDMDGNPNGYIGGYCASFARVPPPASFDPSQPLPRSNCPPGAVVSALERDFAGDVTTCWHGCATDGDCRSGYACEREAMSGGPYAGGRCAPMNCLDPGRTCPTGYSCHPFMGSMTYGSCGR